MVATLLAAERTVHCVFGGNSMAGYDIRQSIVFLCELLMSGNNNAAGATAVSFY